VYVIRTSTIIKKKKRERERLNVHASELRAVGVMFSFFWELIGLKSQKNVIGDKWLEF